MSKMSKKNKEKQFKSIGNHQQFLNRITKTLYYGKLPSTERLSLPVTELASELFSEAQAGRSLDRLHCNDAAKVSRNACVSPCSLVLAVLYLEQLKTCNPEYLHRIAPSELFLISLMVSSKFLHDDGEEDEVFIDEWASSGGISTKELAQLEKEFLAAIDWKIFVQENLFWKKLGEIEKVIAKKEGFARGWYTYTEIQKLMAIDVTQFMQRICTALSVLTVTYTLGILTLLGSVFIASNIPGNYLHKSSLQIKTNDSAMTDEVNNIYDPTRDSFDNSHSSEFKNKRLDAADVLKTSILLASLQSNNLTTAANETELVLNLESNNVSKDSWAWWSNPTMNWLTSISRTIENFDFIPEYKRYDNYLDKSVQNLKIYNLEDQIHKATKVRLQDQMERSWHKEWTDSLKNVIFEYNLLSLYF
ncbi:hypothetical protein FQR65_LT06521 [Abscondita terminalis]|nr:hypothetical protein FQR65_LT06521 [Abscondita terminalis]